jgi:quercetin dioxygenase-like cupin family protein
MTGLWSTLITGGYMAHVDGIKVKIKGPVDVAVVHVTFQPGGTLGWHHILAPLSSW